MKNRTQANQPVLESLEIRTLMSSSLVTHNLGHGVKLKTPTTDYAYARHTLAKDYTNYQILTPAGDAKPNSNGASSPLGYTPSQIIAAYGISNISFGSAAGTGAGETIAIIDAYDDPSFVDSTASNFSESDLARFDSAFGISDPPSFTKVNQSGGTTMPAQNTDWDGEIALDVEWSHAIAPQANIVLVEANSSGTTNLDAAVNYAKTIPGVVAITMSYGGSESSSEASMDSVYTTPAGHQGITFLASTGDSGAPGEYQAYSPNVVAVGGTSLTLSNGAYGSETGWSDSGGGTSKYELKPSYQNLITTPSATLRTTPDISMDADPNTGVAVLDTSASGIGSANPWINGYVGGTSLASPIWAGLIAIADQGRSLAGLSSLSGPQTLNDLYSLPSTDFHDITSGNNGYSAGTGYDLVTGRGSPVANLLIPALANTFTASSTTLTLQTDSTGTIDQIYTTSSTTGTPAYSVSKSSVSALDLAGNNLTLNFANGNPLSGVDVTYDGSAITLNDSTLADNVAFSSTAITADGSTINTSGITQVNFNGGNNLDSVAVNAGPAVVFTASQQLASLSIVSGANAQLEPGNLVLYTQSLSLPVGANLDLTDGTLIDNSVVNYQPTIVSDLTTGYANGNWNGGGLDTSSATNEAYHSLGYAVAADLGDTAFDGIAVLPTATIVKFTWAGDANLDGSINDADVTLMSAQQALGKTTWAAGNFNYNNAINSDDWMIFSMSAARAAAS
jgi:subtilase family serine protease